MTLSARVGDLVFVGHVRRDERECVGADFHVGDCGGDFWHVASDATAAGGTFFMMRVFFESCGAGAIEGKRAVAVEADLIAGLS